MQLAPAPDALFSPASRVMVILAHQDDEVTFAGLVQRLPPGSRFMWVTNGDGLSDQLGMADADYAEMRRKETVRAMALAGFGEDRLRFLGHSEKSIYARLASLDDQGAISGRAETLSFFKDIAAQVNAEVATFRPEFIITHAWQGGQPEHDLSHLMAVLAARRIPGCQVLEVPEYELAYTVFLRFGPWRTGPIHEICLTASEMQVKKAMLACYVSQRKGLFLSRLLAMAGDVIERGRELVLKRRLIMPSFQAREHFGPVPVSRDYRVPPHGIDHLEYIGDDWQKKPMSFRKMVVPVVCALEQ